ncbi:MAG: hypothetical protein H6Q90_5040 [Deltaproteobacteria bacterium]|nr:hypothetical protein [Deltaproteobacteria bacterium]
MDIDKSARDGGHGVSNMDALTIERAVRASSSSGGSPDFEEEAPTTELVRPLPETSRKIRRGRRTRPRSKTIAMRRVTVAEREIFALMYPPEDVARPQTRAECREHAGPCPWVACKHHLYLDVNPVTGSIKINFPDREPWELEHTCALDVAESAGGLTLEQVGEITNLTRERIRQVEALGLSKLEHHRQLR